jgi:hypothetical protein
MRELSSAATAFCKANRICAERFPGLLVACTGDLLAHPTVRDSLGKDALATAVFGALYHGRMRVLALHSAWAIELIRDSRDPPGFILAENFLLVALFSAARFRRTYCDFAGRGQCRLDPRDASSSNGRSFRHRRQSSHCLPVNR